MTREEAIADIRDNIKPVVGGISLDMAIKALEQQPCEDCISRQSVKRKLQEHHDLFINAYGGRVGFKSMADAKEKARVDEINNCIATIVNEPPVTPKEKIEWIPVSERLPENSGTYLVWDKYGYQISDFNAEEQTFGFLNGCNFDYETGEVYPPCWVEHDTVIAWMPLPAPFEPQESEDKE